MLSMKSAIVNSLNLKYSPVAIILTNTKPNEALQFKEGRWGCVAAMLVAASKGRTGVFDRNTFGCVGGGVGLGFGNQYKEFPIEYLLSTGCEAYRTYRGHRLSMSEGERYFKTPELARHFVASLPIVDVPTEFVVFKPLEEVTETEVPTLILFMVNPDQLSALVVLANYDRAKKDTVIVPFGAGCQSILFGYAEAIKQEPSAVIGFFDITVRKLVDRDILSFTVPYKLFQAMEANVGRSFLKRDQWSEVARRIGAEE